MVRSRRIPQSLKDATVAIEDKRFYDHEGVDYYRLVGAALRDLESGSSAQGGSTITMQLVKNLYDPQAGRTLSKKIEEAYLAYQYEKKYTKDEILTQYLNGVFYGQNAVGVQAAALTYFDTDVWNITLPQAALLAGLPAGAERLQPVHQPRAGPGAAQRGARPDGRPGLHQPRDGRAGRCGAGLALKRGHAYKRKREEYFFEYVRQVLIDRYGENEVQRGGFRVYTTIDSKLQTAARDGHQGEPLLRRRPGVGGRDDRLQERLHPRDGLQPDLQPGEPVQPAPPRPSASRARPSRRSC